ncbi:hypothetical protein NL676_036917 [Syzygium grande]|nr:hypothetical protein NL676_036917 [Syzygium grande]
MFFILTVSQKEAPPKSGVHCIVICEIHCSIPPGEGIEMSGIDEGLLMKSRSCGIGAAVADSRYHHVLMIPRWEIIVIEDRLKFSCSQTDKGQTWVATQVVRLCLLAGANNALFGPRIAAMFWDVCWIGGGTSAAGHLRCWDVLVVLLRVAGDRRYGRFSASAVKLRFDNCHVMPIRVCCVEMIVLQQASGMLIRVTVSFSLFFRNIVCRDQPRDDGRQVVPVTHGRADGSSSPAINSRARGVVG